MKHQYGKADHDFWVHVHDPARAADFDRVFLGVYGNATAPVRSPIPHMSPVVGLGNVLVYELAVDLLSGEERARLVAVIAERFEMDPAVVESKLDDVGMPILAADCTLAVHNPQRWF